MCRTKSPTELGGALSERRQAITVRSFKCALSLVGLVAVIAGCSGGSGSGGTSSGYGSENESAKGPCYEPIAFNDPVDLYGKGGVGRFTSEQTNGKEIKRVQFPIC